METGEAFPYLLGPLPTALALGLSRRLQTPDKASAGSGVGLSGSHLPNKGQVSGKGAFVQGVVFREEDPRALGKKPGRAGAVGQERQETERRGQ